MVQARLAKLAFHIVFLGEAEAAMRLDAHVGRKPARLARQHLGNVRLRSGAFPGVEHTRGLGHHFGSCGKLDVRARDRKLDALIFADRAAEDIAILRVSRSAVDEKAPIANAFAGDKDPLGIHAGKDVAKALPLLPDQCAGWHAQIIEEQLRRRVIEHGSHGPHGQPVADRLTHIDQKHAHAIGRLGAFVARGGAA